jgi:hypothetical protein
MSRHEIGNERYAVTLGWDRPMDTFFATVFDRKDDRDCEEALIWLGNDVGEYQEASLLLDCLRQEMRQQGIANVEIPDSIAQTLEEDKQHEGKGFAERPLEIQRFVLENQLLG